MVEFMIYCPNRPIRFVFGLTREDRRIKDEHNGFGLSNCKDGVAIPMGTREKRYSWRRVELRT